MNKLIKRITEEYDHPETIIEKTASISFDGVQYLVRIPNRISEYLKINKENKIKFIVNTAHIRKTGKKELVVEIIEKE